MLKISDLYLIGNPEICQEPPSCGQDDQTLLTLKYFLNLQGVPKSLILKGQVSFKKFDIPVALDLS